MILSHLTPYIFSYFTLERCQKWNLIPDITFWGHRRILLFKNISRIFFNYWILKALHVSPNTEFICGIVYPVFGYFFVSNIILRVVQCLEIYIWTIVICLIIFWVDWIEYKLITIFKYHYIYGIQMEWFFTVSLWIGNNHWKYYVVFLQC